MAGHHYILSPLDQPWAYTVFLLHWISSLVCVGVSIYFYCRKKGSWWLLIALAFGLPLLGTIVIDASMGLPPLPYGTAYPPVDMPSVRPGYTAGTSSHSETSIYLDTISPMVAAALLCGFFAERKTGRGLRQ